MWERKTTSDVAMILVLTLCASLAEGNDVEISPLNTPEDIDLSGNIIYAINFGNNGNPRFDDFVFSQDEDYPEVSLSASGEQVVPPSYGAFPDTGYPNLNMLIGGVAWTNDGPGRCITSISAGGLDVGTSYQLQLVFYEARTGENRLLEVIVDGETVVKEYDIFHHQGSVVGKGASVLKYTFSAKDEILDVDIIPGRNDGGHLSSVSGLILAKLWFPSPDFNGDSMIDIKDLIILIEHWGQNESSLDLAPQPHGDGIIDVQDLEVLMSYWEQELDDPTLVAHWKLDETEGVIAQDSAGENDAVVMGSAMWRPESGMVDGALEFDGVEDHTVTFVAASLREGPFSVFAWAKGATPGQVVIAQQGAADWLSTDPVDGCLMTEFGSSTEVQMPLFSDAVITDGDWHRIGLVWDGTKRILCVDEEEVANDAQNELVIPETGLLMGAGATFQPGSFWAGLIDDVRIYNRVIHP